MHPALLALALAACTGEPPEQARQMADVDDDAPSTADDSGPAPVDSAAPAVRDLHVTVTLDGEPLAGAPVQQPGTDRVLETDDAGRVVFPVDVASTVPGIAVSHPAARIGGPELVDSDFEEGVTIALQRYADGDNPLYVFQDPGTPEIRDSTTYCAHCHVTINADWYGSAHRRAASNAVVQDVYAGAAAAWADASACDAAGGTWRTGVGPGTGAAADRCYLGTGTLPDLNPDCAETPCDGIADATGACADCHAPGIDGALGGRDLLQATGLSYDYGVHCDVCHKVESVDLDSLDPGVSGRLRILRPSEEGTTAGPWKPLTFGPHADVLNPRMGSVQRGHYADATICAGCHEHHQPALVPGAALDAARWPDGTLPIHTTWSELRDGPLGADVVCQSCHMPPDPDVGNGADLENLFDIGEGLAGGWLRPAGAVRRHVWFGPRHAEQRMIDLAAAVGIHAEVDGDDLLVTTTVRNTGPGHAIPTGEPLRHLLLVVEARCDGARLTPRDGPTVPDYGGAVATQDASGDWTRWPDAAPGMRVRVVRRTGAWRDYEGYGPFGDGTFSVEDKGVPEEVLAGEAAIDAVGGDGTVVLAGPLPAGDVAYLVHGPDALPAEGAAWADLAGLPGFGFARVLADADGRRMVPHHAAVDVVSDTRLLPTRAMTVTHRFPAACDAPEVAAALLHRGYPKALAAERGWPMTEAVMAEAR